MSIVRLSALLDAASGGALAKLTRRAGQLDDLASALRKALPPEAAKELVAASPHEDGRLVLICSSPSWAARLRFESEDLLAAARLAGVVADRVEVRVAKAGQVTPPGRD